MRQMIKNIPRQTVTCENSATGSISFFVLVTEGKFSLPVTAAAGRALQA